VAAATFQAALVSTAPTVKAGLPNTSYFPTPEHLHQLCGRLQSCGRRATPALFVLGGEERVLEDPRRPGGLPHKLCGIPGWEK
jgi:hypothetical protein